MSVNGGAVTCGEHGFSTQYSRTSASAIGFQMMRSCVYNYATLPKLARVRCQPSAPVTVIMSGFVRIMPASSLKSGGKEDAKTTQTIAPC